MENISIPMLIALPFIFMFVVGLFGLSGTTPLSKNPKKNQKISVIVFNIGGCALILLHVLSKYFGF
jgi:hypothetical protein